LKIGQKELNDDDFVELIYSTIDVSLMSIFGIKQYIQRRKIIKGRDEYAKCRTIGFNHGAIAGERDDSHCRHFHVI
jgi:hypothetical protein